MESGAKDFTQSGLTAAEMVTLEYTTPGHDIHDGPDKKSDSLSAVEETAEVGYEGEPEDEQDTVENI